MILSDVLEHTIQASIDAADAPPAIVSHIGAVDDILYGVRPGNLIIVAGEPGSGKTALAVQMAINAAKYDGKKILIFSLEMTLEELGARILACQSGVEMRHIVDGTTDEAEMDRLSTACEKMTVIGSNVRIYEEGDITPSWIKARCKEMQTEIGLDLVVVDYIQIMRSDRRWSEKRQEIDEIAKALKNIAKELKIPVIACSQLSRARAGRKSKRPLMTDLKESGTIEQVADAILFVYPDDDDTDRTYIRRIYTAKNRNGEPRQERLVLFDGAYMRFENYSTDAERLIMQRYADPPAAEPPAAQDPPAEPQEEVDAEEIERHYEQLMIGGDYDYEEDDDDEYDYNVPF